MSGYSAEYIPHEQHTWRMLKKGGKPIIFLTRREAEKAAAQAFLSTIDGKTRSTLPVNPERLEAKLSAEAEQWIRSSREDKQKQTTMHRAGKRQVVILSGRA
jgi:hypothetical protein